MPFEIGNRANPGGRPKKTDQQRNFERKCQEWAELFAFEKLKKWADSNDPMASRSAVVEILNRGFGKPVETSIIDANVATESGHSVKDLEGEAAILLGEPTATGVRLDGESQVDA